MEQVKENIYNNIDCARSIPHRIRRFDCCSDINFEYVAIVFFLWIICFLVFVCLWKKCFFCCWHMHKWQIRLSLCILHNEWMVVWCGQRYRRLCSSSRGSPIQQIETFAPESLCDDFRFLRFPWALEMFITHSTAKVSNHFKIRVRSAFLFHCLFCLTHFLWLRCGEWLIISSDVLEHD